MPPKPARRPHYFTWWLGPGRAASIRQPSLCICETRAKTMRQSRLRGNQRIQAGNLTRDLLDLRLTREGYLRRGLADQIVIGCHAMRLGLWRPQPT
jgi:hypothetical protein